MPDETLESQSLWYKYKTTIWPQDTPETAVVHNIMRVLRSIHHMGPLAYISVPITSGKIYYQLRKINPTREKSELMESVIDHNYHLGTTLVKEVAQRRNCPVLYPADLIPVHQKWEQAHFQALWLSIIAEKCTELHLCEGWEYSNGGVEEFTHVVQLRLGLPRHKDLIFFNTKEAEQAARNRMKNIKLFNHQCKTVCIKEGVEKIQQSSSWLNSNGFRSEKIEECLRILDWTQAMIKQKFYQ